MKIVLVNPPIIDRTSIEIPTRAHNPFEHMGLAYIAAVLRQKGHEVKIIDSYITTRTNQQTLELIEKESPNLVGFSATHEFLTASVQIADLLRKKSYSGHITMGGYLPTFLHDTLIQKYTQFDSIVRGEGENTIVELIDNLDSPDKWDKIPGITYQRNGGIHVNPSRDLIDDVGALPHPARDTLPELARMYDYSAISSSRGCPMSCSFCSIRSFYNLSKGKVWRARPAENVADEMETLVKRHNVGQIAFTDDNFMGPPGAGVKRAFDLSRELLKRRLDVEFSILIRVDSLDEGLLQMMKMAGLRSLFVGFESGVDRALKTFNKRITAQENRNAVDMIKRVGVKCFPGFIMFDPYTTMDEIRENLDFVEYAERGSDLIKIDDYLGGLQPFTGTPIKAQLEKEGRLIVPDSPLIPDDRIPTYHIENPDVETLRRTVKANRRRMARPLFDEHALIRRAASKSRDAWDALEPFDKRFNDLIQRMRDFEKTAFREFMEYIEKTPGVKPEDAERVADRAEVEVKRFNEEVESINKVIRERSAEGR